jgi:hypothetical protein
MAHRARRSRVAKQAEEVLPSSSSPTSQQRHAKQTREELHARHAAGELSAAELDQAILDTMGYPAEEALGHAAQQREAQSMTDPHPHEGALYEESDKAFYSAHGHHEHDHEHEQEHDSDMVADDASILFGGSGSSLDGVSLWSLLWRSVGVTDLKEWDVDISNITHTYSKPQRTSRNRNNSNSYCHSKSARMRSPPRHRCRLELVSL